MPSKRSLSLKQQQLEAAKQPKNLLHLPIELQIKIFKLVLLEPSLQERRHREGCDLRPESARTVSQPPFMSHRVYVQAFYDRSCRGNAPYKSWGGLFTPPRSFHLHKTWTYCDCGRRAGVHLLRTNRWVFHVAAGIFWSGNRFSFFDATEFAACMAATSPGTRALIRDVHVATFRTKGWVDARVSLLSKIDDGLDRPGGVFPWKKKCLPAFWDALLLLPNLQRLAFPPCYLDPVAMQQKSADEVVAVIRYLERLGEFDLTHLGLAGGCNNMYHHSIRSNFWARFFDGLGLESLCGFSNHIYVDEWFDGEVGPGAFLNYLAALQYDDEVNFAGAMYGAANEQVMISDRTTFRGCFWKRPHDAILGGTGTVPVDLVTWGDTIHDFTFYNMPMSEAECRRNHAFLQSQSFEWKMANRLARTQNPKRSFLSEFESSRLDDFNYSTRGLPRRSLASSAAERAAKQQPPKAKRERVKKSRRGNRRKGKGDEWDE